MGRSSSRYEIAAVLEGFNPNQLADTDKLSTRTVSPAFKDTSHSLVSARIQRITPYFSIIKGLFPSSATTSMGREKFILVLIDCDLYLPIADSLEFFRHRMLPSGIILVHDYNSPYYQGAAQAVDEFCSKYSLTPVLIPDKSGTVAITFPHEKVLAS